MLHIDIHNKNHTSQRKSMRKVFYAHIYSQKHAFRNTCFKHAQTSCMYVVQHVNAKKTRPCITIYTACKGILYSGLCSRAGCIRVVLVTQHNTTFTLGRQYGIVMPPTAHHVCHDTTTPLHQFILSCPLSLATLSGAGCTHVCIPSRYTYCH